MTQQQIFEEFKSYPKAQKSVVIRQLLRMFEEDLEKEAQDGNELSINERIAIAKNLSGCLRPEAGFIPMTREEEREVITEYLEEKYS